MTNSPPTRPGAGRMVEPTIDPATRANLQALELGGRLLKAGYDAAKREGPTMSKIARFKNRMAGFTDKVDKHIDALNGKLDKLEPGLDQTMDGAHDMLDAHSKQIKEVEDFVHDLAQDGGGHNGGPTDGAAQ